MMLFLVRGGLFETCIYQAGEIDWSSCEETIQT